MNASYSVHFRAKGRPPLEKMDGSSQKNSNVQSFLSPFQAKIGSFSPSGRELEVAFYNVENLFDTEHDKGKNDWEFLPQDYPGKREACEKLRGDYFREKCLSSDWTEKKLDLKIDKIVEIFLRERDHLPDILGLCEVENRNVLKKLAKALGYEKFIVTEGPDRRGIDVAILYQPSSKLRLIEKKEHKIEGDHFIAMPTRNILEGVFEVGGKYEMAIYINHWPSQRNPSQARLVVSRRLKSLILEKKKNNPDTRILAMGDFNTIPHDFPRPIRGELTESVEPSAGGESLLYDVHKAFLRTGPKVEKNLLSRGTYFYVKNMEWNQLDRFLISPDFFNEKGLKADIDSYKIYSPEFATKTFKYEDPNFWTYGTSVAGVPKKYDFQTTDAEEAGFSDHFPIVLGLYF
jgi:predicted extracellular nuclease